MPIQIGARADHDFDEPLGLLSDCHRRIEHFLSVIARVAGDRRGGPLSKEERVALEASLRYFATAAPRHTADEEQSLFPRLRACTGGDAATVRETLRRLEEEHAETDRRHAAVDALVRRWLTTGRLDAAAVTELTRHIAALQSIYGEHIAIEDQQLFPAAARLLSADQLQEVGGEMADRRGVRFPRIEP